MRRNNRPICLKQKALKMLDYQDAAKLPGRRVGRSNHPAPTNGIKRIRL
jgi:hypothetical protein